MKPTGGTVIQLEKDKPRSRCRKWELRANFGKVNGKYPKRTKRFDGTYREAQAALVEWLAELELEDERERTPTFSEFAWAWHGRRVKNGVLAERTLDRERYRIKTAEAMLGDKPMKDITADDLEALYAAMLDGTLKGRKLAPSTVRTLVCTLSPLFEDAMRRRVIDSKPTQRAKAPRVPQRLKQVPSTRSVDALIDALDPRDPRQLAVMLCAACGLRRSEAVALEWEDIDGTRLHVTRSSDDKGEPKPTKNMRIRDVPVPSSVIEKLEPVRGTGRMCKLKPLSLSQWWRRNRASYDNMEGVGLHELRHAYATRLAEAGVHPRVMQQLGGWETIDVCMEIYTHVHSSTLDEAVERAFSR